MNDFQMSHLAASHFDQLRAEADRQRVASIPQRNQEPTEAARSRRLRLFRFSSLLRRAVA